MIPASKRRIAVTTEWLTEHAIRYDRSVELDHARREYVIKVNGIEFYAPFGEDS